MLDYTGKEDHEAHMARFESLMTLHQYNEGIRCRLFSTTLSGLAQKWFYKLDPGSIHNFNELYDVFMHQFSSSNRAEKTTMSLMDIQQEPQETLSEYAARFNMAALELEESKAAGKADAERNMAKKTGKMEERNENRYPDKPCVRAPPPRGPTMYNINTKQEHLPKAGERKTEDVEHRPLIRGRTKDSEEDVNHRSLGFTMYTPLNQSQEDIFHTIKNYRWFYPPRFYNEGPSQLGPNSLLCEFHSQLGHTTEGCSHLKNKLESLV
ncbi:uncharacterized protein LOC131006462 [Salvia miltiorrhiza]|uniref:uncharacterized protein LOC131006462 n=1 Tax=Salvia miltiorrhiza TaxID=226208 RepID=UPI0025AC3233|nr:uncharacterized protein LOC131006462 [Salvia miltiorrhiza]